METIAWRCRECGASNGRGTGSCRECDATTPSALPIRVVTSLRTVRAPSSIVGVTDAEWEEVRPLAAPAPRRPSAFERVTTAFLILAAIVVASVFAFFIAIVWIGFSR
jgi:hypothetical protein